MEIALVLLILFSMVTGTLSFIGLFRPLPRLYLPTRKRAALVWVASLLVFAMAVELLPPSPPGEFAARATQRVSPISFISFEEVHEKFGTQGTLTDLQKDREWEKYAGKCVEWDGQLAHLDEGVFGGINIGFKHLQSTLTYDVLVSAPGSEKERLLSWRQGATYQYKARLKNYGGALLPISADWGCD